MYCTFKYFPLHLIKQYGSDVRLPNSELINEKALNLPLHQNLSDEEVSKIIRIIKDFKEDIEDIENIEEDKIIVDGLDIYK